MSWTSFFSFFGNPSVQKDTEYSSRVQKLQKQLSDPEECIKNLLNDIKEVKKAAEEHRIDFWKKNKATPENGKILGPQIKLLLEKEECLIRDLHNLFMAYKIKSVLEWRIQDHLRLHPKDENYSKMSRDIRVLTSYKRDGINRIDPSVIDVVEDIVKIKISHSILETNSVYTEFNSQKNPLQDEMRDYISRKLFSFVIC